MVYYYKSIRPGNLILTDALDVGDTASEKNHNYTISGKTWEQSNYAGYDGYERDYEHDMLRDKGYGFNGSSEFKASIAPDNSGVKLRRRIYRTNNGMQLANVYVDGVNVKERPWDIVTQSTAPWYQGWYDSDFEIPASYTNGKNSIRIKVEYEKGGSQSEINAFYYWIFSYAEGADSNQSKANQELSVHTQTSDDGSTAQHTATATIVKTNKRTDQPEKLGNEGFIKFDTTHLRVRSVVPEYISKIDFGDSDVSDGSLGNPTISSSISAGPANSKLKNLGTFITKASRTITLYVTDQNQHRLSLNFPDVEKNSHNQKIEILDLKEKTLVPEVLLTDFEKGKMPEYLFSGNIKIRITDLEDQNTVLVPELFFDGQE